MGLCGQSIDHIRTTPDENQGPSSANENKVIIIRDPPAGSSACGLTKRGNGFLYTEILLN